MKTLDTLKRCYAWFLIFAPCLPCFAQGTVFTYQGRLDSGGAPYNGSAEIQPTLWDAITNGTQVTTNNPASVVAAVTNGLFVLPLDFGANFPGADRWLQLEVRTTLGPFITLTPRQQITPTPYAIYSASAVTASSVASNSITVSQLLTPGAPAAGQVLAYDGNGFVWTNPPATGSSGWSLSGNSSTIPGSNFLGTIDSQPLELWVNQARALRLEPDTNNFGAPNVIGGSPANFVDPGVIGATIAGGGVLNYTTNGYEPGLGSNRVSAVWGTIGGGRRNTVAADHSTISGGHDNLIQAFAYDSVIGGGEFNTISNSYGQSVIAGGYGNKTAGYDAAVGGGYLNLANASYATVGGGYANTVSEYDSVIGGGQNNSVQRYADHAFIGGGQNNTIVGSATLPVYAVVSGGLGNTVQTNSSYPVIGGGSGNIIQSNSTAATVAGGTNNLAGGNGGTVGGGGWNIANGQLATVAGGNSNTADYFYATTGGGKLNTASGSYATVPGGYNNQALGGYSFAGGDQAQALHLGSFVWSDASGSSFSSTAANQFSVRAAGGIRFAADVQMGGDSRYHNLSLSGGNALGYLYGSFPAYADGIHLGYNYYADNTGSGHVFNTGGATSRLTVGYGFVGIYVGGVNAAPTTQRLYADTTHIEVDGTFNNNSDRNAKQDFAPINPSQILERVAQLPLSEWSYKDDPTTRHVGPMAQDFYSRFNLGTDDKHIAPIDEGGVAFAAIQGLNQRLTRELQQKEAEIMELKQRLDTLEKMVRNPKSN